MATLIGRAGSARFGADAIHEITSWKLDVARDAKETTSMTLTDDPVLWQTFVKGLAGASGSLTGNYSTDDTDGQDAIWTNLLTDDPLTLDLILDIAATPDPKKFTADVIFTKPSFSVPVDDIITVSYDFTVTGAVTRV